MCDYAFDGPVEVGNTSVLYLENQSVFYGLEYTDEPLYSKELSDAVKQSAK